VHNSIALNGIAKLKKTLVLYQIEVN